MVSVRRVGSAPAALTAVLEEQLARAAALYGADKVLRASEALRQLTLQLQVRPDLPSQMFGVYILRYSRGSFICAVFAARLISNFPLNKYLLGLYPYFN